MYNQLVLGWYWVIVGLMLS